MPPRFHKRPTLALRPDPTSSLRIDRSLAPSRKPIRTEFVHLSGSDLVSRGPSLIHSLCHRIRCNTCRSRSPGAIGIVFDPYSPLHMLLTGCFIALSDLSERSAQVARDVLSQSFDRDGSGKRWPLNWLLANCANGEYWDGLLKLVSSRPTPGTARMILARAQSGPARETWSTGEAVGLATKVVLGDAPPSKLAAKKMMDLTDAARRVRPPNLVDYRWLLQNLPQYLHPVVRSLASRALCTYLLRTSHSGRDSVIRALQRKDARASRRSQERSTCRMAEADTQSIRVTQS